MTLSRDRYLELVESFGHGRILVIGDMMLDRYIYGAVRRISPEAPVPVVSVTHEKGMPGGAANVAWNIQTLGGAGAVAGVVGQDAEGVALLELLRQEGIGLSAMVETPGARTTVKTRIIAERQQVVRVDWESSAPLQNEKVDELCRLIQTVAAEADGMIIEDYGKGVVNQRVVDTVLAVARERKIPVGYDPKDDHSLDVRGVTVATPNRKEAYAALGRPEPIEEKEPLDDQDLLDMARTLQAKWGVEFLIVTLGPQGMLLLEQNGEVAHAPTRAREVFDVSGAGDTVIATATLALAAGATHREAAELANYAAGVVVAQLGTAPCTREALLEQMP